MGNGYSLRSKFRFTFKLAAVDDSFNVHLSKSNHNPGMTSVKLSFMMPQILIGQFTANKEMNSDLDISNVIFAIWRLEEEVGILNSFKI